MNLPLAAADLAQRFDHPSVLAIALLSNHTRSAHQRLANQTT
jgi:hypothetical protein